jgi:hypothetical protein
VATSIRGLLRAILSENPNLETNEIIRRVKLRGGKASDESIRHSLHNLKSDMNRAAKAAGTAPQTPKVAATPPKPVPAAARETPAPKAGPTAPAKAAVPAANLAGVLANVALVNKVVDVAGGVEHARQVAEAVRACGGVEGFLQHLELVAGIRGA